MSATHRTVRPAVTRRRVRRVATGVAVATALLFGAGTGPVAAQDGIAVLNAGGGNAEFQGIRVVYANGLFQIIREGRGQLFSPGSLPPSPMNNMVALGVGEAGSGGTLLTPRFVPGDSLGAGVVQTGWDSIDTTQTSDSSFTSVFTGSVDGLTYTVTMVATYFSPAEYFDLAYRVTVPDGNTQPVRLYFTMDTYLGGSDNGPGFLTEPETCPSNFVVGVRGPNPADPLVEAIQYVGGAPFAGYASENYFRVVFGGSGYGAATLTDLPNVIDDNPAIDNGIGVNWNFGSAAGTSNTEIRMVFSENVPVNCPEPGPGPDPDPGPDTDGDSLPDTIDPDDDGDGIPDEIDPDANGDGIPDNPVEVVATPAFTG